MYNTNNKSSVSEDPRTQGFIEEESKGKNEIQSMLIKSKFNAYL